MKVGVVIDDWKLPIFERHLMLSGFSFEKCPGITEDTLILKVETSEVRDLQNVVTQANHEAALEGPSDEV